PYFPEKMPEITIFKKNLRLFVLSSFALIWFFILLGLSKALGNMGFILDATTRKRNGAIKMVFCFMAVWFVSSWGLRTLFWSVDLVYLSLTSALVFVLTTMTFRKTAWKD